MRQLSWAFIDKFVLGASSALLLFSSAAPALAQSVNIPDLFGDRVQVVEGAPTPLLRGDFDADGKSDLIFLVRVTPSKGGKSIAQDVHVIDKLFDGRALEPTSAVPGLAIVLSGAGKFLLVDVQSPDGGGFFDTPSWEAASKGSKREDLPLKSKKRGSKDLKGFPCLGRANKGDVILLATESSVDIALPWTGTRFQKCENPNDEP